MYIVPPLFGLALLTFGIYCLKISGKTDHGVLCFFLGLFVTVIALILFVRGIYDAFFFEEVLQGIANIAILLVAGIIGYFECKSLS